MHQFDDDFYGKELRIAITGYIRPEKDFKSIGRCKINFNCYKIVKIHLFSPTLSLNFADELIKEIKNDIRIASERLDDPEMIKYKGNDIFK